MLIPFFYQIFFSFYTKNKFGTPLKLRLGFTVPSVAPALHKRGSLALAKQMHVNHHRGSILLLRLFFFLIIIIIYELLFALSSACFTHCNQSESFYQSSSQKKKKDS